LELIRTLQLQVLSSEYYARQASETPHN